MHMYTHVYVYIYIGWSEHDITLELEHTASAAGRDLRLCRLSVGCVCIFISGVANVVCPRPLGLAPIYGSPVNRRQRVRPGGFSVLPASRWAGLVRIPALVFLKPLISFQECLRLSAPRLEQFMME